MNRWLVSLAVAWLAIAPSQAAEAAGDPRMQVNVTAEKGETLDLQGAIERAAGIMWDRILPQKVRGQVEDSAALPLLMRAVPGTDRFEIEFQPARVWQYIDAQKLPAIRQQPAFNVQIEMRNEYGVRMSGSELALQARVAELAKRWGIGLSEQAPLLALHWQWLGANQVQLNIRGNSRFPEQGETRTFTTGDPMQALQAWLLETLLHARDVYSETQEQEAAPETVPHAMGTELLIHIQRQSALPEQVMIEEALRNDRRVVLLQPRFLSSAEREYSIKLATTDDSWMPAWFAGHGMTATATPDGWLVQ